MRLSESGQRVVMGEVADARFRLAPLAQIADRKKKLLATFGSDCSPFQDFRSGSGRR